MSIKCVKFINPVQCSSRNMNSVLRFANRRKSAQKPTCCSANVNVYLNSLHKILLKIIFERFVI